MSARLTYELNNEINRASARFGPFKSSHEGYGVLAEEVAELLDAIRANDAPSIIREAIQVAAVAMRLAEALSDDAGCFERSGCGGEVTP
jgi:NTP pyrophosphatase (non-canonical NTP hydrolase)